MSDLDDELERAEAEVRLRFTVRIYQARDDGLLTDAEADRLIELLDEDPKAAIVETQQIMAAARERRSERRETA